MSKLGLLTDLKNDDTDRMEDADLSDFEFDPLIKNSEPYAFLCVKKSCPLIFNKALEIFDLTARVSSFETTLVCKIKSENFKMDVLNLLAASLFLHAKNSNQKFYLGVSKSLMGILSQSDIAQKNFYKGEELEVDNFDYAKSCITLSQSVQHTLHQAGMDVLTNSPHLSFDKKQVEELLFKFTNKKTNLTRAG